MATLSPPNTATPLAITATNNKYHSNSHLAIAEPLAVERSLVGLGKAQLLEEGVFGLVDKEVA